MAGGGTGGHVIPALAVASELCRRGEQVLFIGTRRGMEATLVPRAGFPMAWISIGGLQRVGLRQTLKTLAQLPWSVVKCVRTLRSRRAAAVFSMGGYVAAPVMLAAVVTRTPIVVMEPNAMPGLVSRRFAGRVERALVSFEETARFFPAGRAEVTGLPVRKAFFDIPARAPGSVFEVLITGGSRGSHALNQAARESWPLVRAAGLAVRMKLQSGAAEYEELAREFNATGLDGEVAPFIHDMSAAYAAADLVVSRSGAGAVSELAAAGKPSLLVPFPFATDDHQRHNAEAMRRAGASLLCLESEWSGRRLFELVRDFCARPEELGPMGAAARGLARPGAAARAADVLVALGAGRAKGLGNGLAER